MDGTEQTDRQRQAATALLAAVDGDERQAIAAIRRYSQPTAPTQTTRPQQPHDQPLIKLSQLAKSYKIGKQTVHAIDDISLTIYQGEFIAITGASGSGKSTLLQLIGGLDKPSSGEVVIGDTALHRLRDRQLSRFRNQTIGFVFQFFYLQPFLTLRRNIEVSAMPGRMKRRKRRERVETIAAQVGLAERLNHLPKELSGGQIQRAAIARALLNQPAIILADEPTGNLDSDTSHAIVSLFESIRTQANTTIIIATHDDKIAAQADRIIHISDGKIV